MKQFAALALCAVVAEADTTVTRTWSVEDSAPGDMQYEGKDQWRCGNADAISSDNYEAKTWQNINAGIVQLREYSLDHVRPPNSGKTFEDLHCASYIRKYKNPIAPGLEGVCVRDIKNAWDSIIEADREAEETWNLFKTENGYQRTASKYKDAPVSPLDYQTQWGSGAEGPNPNNWCDAYMREMICHVAFPQFAGNQTHIDANEGTGRLAPVRPVSRNKCESMMDNCNRHEPKPYSGVVSWLENIPFIDPDQSHDNVFYCDAWNRGFGLAKAGCGVGAGDEGSEDEFTATWDASSSLTPIGLLAVVATILALVQ